MGGGEHGNGGDWRAKVWSMPSGPNCRPKHWCRNTAFALLGYFFICVPVAIKFAQLERIKIYSTMCHQCQRNDSGPFVRCTKCKTKQYCIPCLEWYPLTTHEEIAQACPVCLGNCNCKSCLQMDVAKKVNEGFIISDQEKIEHSKYLLRTILPFHRQLNKEQMMEKEAEAKILGIRCFCDIYVCIFFSLTWLFM